VTSVLPIPQLTEDACYRAISSRDARFDGVFFVAVKTTGVYCRPICPARTPGRARCEFFARAAEAERAGYRACFRCRPEVAPGHASVDANNQLAHVAAARIEAGFLNEHSIEELAEQLGVTARHLRRTVQAALGASPVELAQTARLALAKQLLHDSKLSLADVAFASGFTSVRRFNALLRERFGKAPTLLRREHGASDAADCIALRLDYRAPYDFHSLLGFLRGRAIAGVEVVGEDEYVRSLALGEHRGFIAVKADEARGVLRARVSLTLAPKLMEIAAKLRGLFDLSARPDVIARDLKRDPLLKPLVTARPGLRVAGSMDGFETAVRTILGQQVSVRGATTLSGRFAERFGTPIEPHAFCASAGVTRVFPSAEVIASADVHDVRAIGMPLKRAHTIVALARAVASGEVQLVSGADPEHTMAALTSIPGIGPWTASYLAMRVLRWPNAFPAGDLILHRALDAKNAKAAIERARAFEPWRAYATLHLWRAWSERVPNSQGG
jgi:AraC family transcriptional regulator of adaptative response / DNA-3-methyladenine glycosylase II